MERSEAMRQLGTIFSVLLTTEAPAEINGTIAMLSHVMEQWLPGSKATCLVDSAGKFAGPVLHAPRNMFRRLDRSQPYLYASVVLVYEDDGTVTVEKNRYGRANCDLSDISWVDDDEPWSFKDTV